jgi:hypothetical protein
VSNLFVDRAEILIKKVLFVFQAFWALIISYLTSLGAKIEVEGTVKKLWQALGWAPLH